MKLYSGEYSRVDYMEETSLLETVWMPRSSELSKDYVKFEMKRFLDLVNEKKPKSIIADTRYFGFKVDHDLQHWIVLQYMSEIIDAGTQRYAILVTEEHFTNLNKTTAVEEGSEDFHVRYFTSHTEAFRWATAKRSK
jgi:hypothetical protein